MVAVSSRAYVVINVSDVIASSEPTYDTDHEQLTDFFLVLTHLPLRSSQCGINSVKNCRSVVTEQLRSTWVLAFNSYRTSGLALSSLVCLRQTLLSHSERFPQVHNHIFFYVAAVNQQWDAYRVLKNTFNM